MPECDKRPAEHKVMSCRHKRKGKKGQHHNCSCSIIISIIDTSLCFTIRMLCCGFWTALFPWTIHLTEVVTLKSHIYTETLYPR